MTLNMNQSVYSIHFGNELGALTFTVGLHSGGRVDRVPKQAVARHLRSHHPCTHRAYTWTELKRHHRYSHLTKLQNLSRSYGLQSYSLQSKTEHQMMFFNCRVIYCPYSQFLPEWTPTLILSFCPGKCGITNVLHALTRLRAIRAISTACLRLGSGTPEATMSVRVILVLIMV